MNKQFSDALTVLFLNTIVVHIFLFVLNSNKYWNKLQKELPVKWSIIKKITGIIYWNNNILLKLAIIILVLSYIFIVYVFTIFILSKVNMISNMKLISVPLRIFCIIFAINFIALCIRLYCH
jgi:hypothetical protein